MSSLETLQEAVSYVSCPYYRGVGICDVGCRDEPYCQTGEPAEGWLTLIADTATEMRDEDPSAQTREGDRA